jgi:hypothetical protein
VAAEFVTHQQPHQRRVLEGQVEYFANLPGASATRDQLSTIQADLLVGIAQPNHRHIAQKLANPVVVGHACHGRVRLPPDRGMPRVYTLEPVFDKVQLDGEVAQVHCRLR